MDSVDSAKVVEPYDSLLTSEEVLLFKSAKYSPNILSKFDIYYLNPFIVNSVIETNNKGKTVYIINLAAVFINLNFSSVIHASI